MPNATQRRFNVLKYALVKGGITKATPIAALDINNRAFNALAKRRVHTVGDLMQMSEVQLVAIEGIGRGTLAHIRSELDGVRFRTR